jgi:phage/conjugal plasmid C-4 type zinc finger TraR family protein
MTDEVDFAQAREQEDRDAAILRVRMDARRQRGAGRKDCLACGSEIPEARRIAVPGAKQCTECQGLSDRTAALRR